MSKYRFKDWAIKSFLKYWVKPILVNKIGLKLPLIRNCEGLITDLLTKPYNP